MITSNSDTLETPALAPSPESIRDARPGDDVSKNPPSGTADPVRRIQGLIEQVEAFPNPAAQALMHECIGSLLAMYGEGLGRVINLLNDSDATAQDAFAKLLKDPLFRSLLLIHGLHPLSLEQRLAHALDTVRPYMQSHGGNVEVIELNGEFAKLRLIGACKTCPSSRMTLELAVRKALEEHCPDLAGFEVEAA
jgi:Fe-S cluster biogenesis protein NfuA